MAIRDDIHEIEKKLGFCYPLSFVSCIEEFSVLFASEEFRKTFTDSSLLLSAPEIAEARKNIPEGLIPFMRDEHPSTSDIYAIEPNSNNNELKVLVWSDHAIVMEWENFLVFGLWVKEQIAKHGTVA